MLTSGRARATHSVTLRDTNDAGPCYGLDGSPEMLRNARAYTDDDDLSFLVGDFDDLPFDDDSVDHVWSMEAFYYAADPHHTLEEIARMLDPAGPPTRGELLRGERPLPRVAGAHRHRDDPLERRRVPRGVPRSGSGRSCTGHDPRPRGGDSAGDTFPTDEFETREAMVERYRDWGRC